MTDNIYKVSNIVKEILEEDPNARDSDNYLYYKVLKHIGSINGIDIETMSIPRFFLNIKTYGFPQFETVRRTRQKIQHDNPELAGSREVQSMRAANEEEYRSYALMK